MHSEGTKREHCRASMHREKMSKCKRGRQGGFSFPELMIVIAIALVIAGMASVK